MQRSRIYLMLFLLVAVLGTMMALKTMSGGGPGGGDSGDRADDSAIQIRMVSPRPDEARGDAGEDGAKTAAGDGNAASRVAVTFIGGDGDEVEHGARASDDEGAAGEAVGLPPMAALGAAEGIHTTMDSSWFPEREAAEWFQPLENDFQAARPLTLDRYKEVLGEHHERIGNVLRRSAEIGDGSSPQEGILFLEAWNELVDQYKAEAYGS